MIYSEAGAGVQLLGAAEARVDLQQQHSGNSYLLTTKKTQPSFMVEYWLNYELFSMFHAFHLSTLRNTNNFHIVSTCRYYCNPPVLMFGRASTAPAIRTHVTRQPLQLVRVSMSAISASVLVHYGVMCSSFCSNHTVCTMLTAQLTMASVMMTRNYHHYQHQIINNPYTGFGPILFVH